MLRTSPTNHAVSPAPAPPAVRTTSDGLLAIFAAALTLVIYLLTIYPGLFGMGDAAKFAFVGKVLGTPHAPGYPLYVMVSHLFSYVPLGSLAYRMNVLSAILAALAVAVWYFAARVIGVRPGIAFAIALAFGFGRAFWSKAQYPKGYSLNAALVCAGILLLLRWGRTRKPSHLYWTIAVFALASGNHLIIISLLPALTLYVLLVDARQALAPRTLVTGAVLIMLGLSQYSLILVRTWQEAPYLEARATNVRELVSVMTARRYANEIGAYSYAHVIQTRVPIVAGLVKDELTPIGVVLAAIGVVALSRRRAWREALLCALGATGVIALTVNMSSNEDEGFLLPAFALLWLLVAAAMEGLACFAHRRIIDPADARGRRVVATTVIVLALLIPAEQLAANYRRNDHSRRTFEIRYYAALFDTLPDRSAIVLDQYNINMMVLYKLLGEGAARGRTIVTVPQSHEQVSALRRQGFQIYAFSEGRQALASYGYQFEPVELYDETLPKYLDHVRERWVIAIAATPAAAPVLRDNPAGWRRIGATESAIFGGSNLPYAFIGTVGAGRDQATAGGARVTAEAGTRLASDAPALTAPISVEATDREAWITVGGVEKARATAGAVVAVVDPAGRIEAHALDPRLRLRVPFNRAIQPLFRVTRAETCFDIGNTGWRDISDVSGEGRASVVINNYRPFDSRAVFYLFGEVEAQPALREVSGRGVPRLSSRTFRLSNAGERSALAMAAAADGFDAARLGGAGLVSRVEVAINDEGDQKAMLVEFGMVPARAFVRATVDLNNPKRATVCGAESVRPD